VTSEHLLYVPTVFAIGLMAGLSFGLRRRHEEPGIQAERRQIRGWWVLVALLVVVIIFAATHLVPTPGGVKAVTQLSHGLPVFDQRPSFSGSEVYERLQAFGDVGREAYQRMTYTTDVAFPLSMLAFLTLLGSYISQRRGLARSIRHWLRALPIAWFAVDMAENALIFLLIEAYPNIIASAPLLGPITILKFVLLLASILMVMAALAWKPAHSSP